MFTNDGRISKTDRSSSGENILVEETVRWGAKTVLPLLMVPVVAMSRRGEMTVIVVVVVVSCRIGLDRIMCVNIGWGRGEASKRRLNADVEPGN